MASRPTWDTIAILGVGLIGGSIGLALKQRALCRQVVGIGRRPTTLQAAKRRGAIDRGTVDLARGVADASLIIVCTPVEQVVEYVERVRAVCRPDAIITDVGSTKARIVEALDSSAELPAGSSSTGASGARFVGSHPMAGSEKTGVQHASADLFDKRTVIVTPGPTSRAADVRRVSRLWRSLGGRIVQMEPHAHDAAVASISHLPHVVSAALAAASPREHLGLIAGGWRDTTRVAAGDPELWRQILLDNRHELLQSLAKFSAILKHYQVALQRGDATALLQLLELGKNIRDAVGN